MCLRRQLGGVHADQLEVLAIVCHDLRILMKTPHQGLFMIVACQLCLGLAALLLVGFGGRGS
jgi:hypothetical protein